MKIWKVVFANDLDAFIPEVWAQESLMILEANMVMAQLVYRDFSEAIAQQGDVVNTRQPAKFTAVRKIDSDDVTVQDADATNVPVTLNQHIHTSFLIKDGEESKGFKVLRDEYLIPAVMSIAQAVDEVIAGEMYQSLENGAGQLGTTATAATVVATREVLNDNLCPVIGRNLVVTSGVEADLLNVAAFVEADKVGDEGSALREGSLGRKFGFQTFMSQNMPGIIAGNSTTAGAVDFGAGYAAGTTSLAVGTFAVALTAGSWCTIAGDMTPQKITTATGSPCTAIVIWPGLKSAVVDTAVVTVYDPGAIDLLAGYSANYSKALAIDGFTVAPKIGQLTSIGDAGSVSNTFSGMTTPTTTAVTTNRALDAAVVNDEVVGIGPVGEYCFAFHRNAVAFVSRPLAAPAAGAGAIASVANYNDVSIRVVITYDGDKQGHLVTVDLLCGVKTLNSDLGCLMYA